MSSVRLAERAPASAPADPRLRRAGAALVAVGVLFLLLPALLVRGAMGLSIDEADYLAKADPAVPELYWTQVRAWGMPVLAAPVALFSAGLPVTRLWFGALSGAGLVAAFWPWRSVLHPAVAPLAALLFATTWYALLHGSLVMPNLYVALGAVGTAGLFLRATTGGTGVLVGAGAAAALVALVRPTDSVLLLAGIAAAALLVPRLRRPRALVAVAVGTALGWLPWVVEAFLRFGGPLERLTGGNEGGLKGGVVAQLTTLQTYPRLLDGSPNYCCYGGPASEAGPLPVLHTTWWLAVPLLVLLGLALARRAGTLPELSVAVVPGALIAGFYLLLLPFGSVRFLLPLTALFALPVASGLVALSRRGRDRRGTGARVLVGLAVMAHLGLMLAEASRELPGTARQREADLRVAQAAEPLAAARPCVVVGNKPQVRSYYLGCRPQGMRARATPPLVRATLAQGGSVVALLDGPPPAGSYLSSWQRVPLPGVGGTWQAYVPPPG